MRAKIKLIIITSLLVGSAVFCAIRWKAWFAIPPEPVWDTDTLNASFVTFNKKEVLDSLQKDTLEFLLLGDIHGSMHPADFDSLANRHSNINFWAQLGDWMERPYFYYEQQIYQSIKGTAFEKLPIIAIPGNHEYLKGLNKKIYSKWTSIFPNPLNGPKRFLGRSYIVDFPTIRFIAIDTDGIQLMSDYTQVSFWLKTVLHEATDRLTIVMMHHPIFSTAKGRQNPFLWMAFYGALREADVVFSGHDHNYARREVKYKERFWSRQQPTIFIGTNASDKNYENKDNVKYECSLSGISVYEHIKVINDSLYIETLELNTGNVVDKVSISNIELTDK